MKELQDWYNGYYTFDGTPLYNPRSVVFALSNGYCDSYWSNTTKLDEVTSYIQNNMYDIRQDIIKLTSGLPIDDVDVSMFSTEQESFETRDQVLAAMAVHGLLSYHDYFLTIPNKELLKKFENALNCKAMGDNVLEIVNKSKRMLNATLSKDTQEMAKIIEEAHELYVPLLEYNDENSLSCIVTLVYLYARKKYNVKREEPAGKGYADYVFYPKRVHEPAFIIELKVNDTPKKAIEQIKKKEYVQSLRDYNGEKLLVGITYNKKDKKHYVEIEDNI